MTTCLTCKHWSLKKSWLAKHGCGICALDSPRSAYGPTKTCEKHSPTTAQVVKLREQHLARIA